MSEKYKTYVGGLFFVTLTIVGLINVFTRHCYCDEMIGNLNYCIKNKDLKIHAFVIIPSHIHMIGSVEKGLITSVLKNFNSYTSKSIIKLVKGNNKESRKGRADDPVANLYVRIL